MLETSVNILVLVTIRFQRRVLVTVPVLLLMTLQYVFVRRRHLIGKVWIVPATRNLLALVTVYAMPMQVILV
tara:strand:- start:1739 stop:1954 length:216 start_codon:yes stop_codon:yes gene_type:complete